MSDADFLKRFGPVFLDSYFVVDRERKIQSANNGFSQLLGLQPAERRKLAGTPCYEKMRLEICEKNCIALQCLERGAAVRMEEIKGRTPEGREIVVELSAVPVRDERGEVSGVFVTHRDVTDERRLKERYLEEGQAHKKERSSLLRIIEERESEISQLRK